MTRVATFSTAAISILLVAGIAVADSSSSGQSTTVKNGPAGSRIETHQTRTSDTTTVSKPIGNSGINVYGQSQTSNPNGRANGTSLEGTNPHNGPTTTHSVGVSHDF